MKCYVVHMGDTPSHLRPRPEDDSGGSAEDVRADAEESRRGGWHGDAAPARRIGIRELRQHASLYVDLAEKGYTVDITNRGRLVAHLVPASEPESPLERLIAAGIIDPAEDPGDLLDVEPGPPVPPGQPTASEILMQMREEERY
jgi:prevent-host-death family protein